MYIYLKYKYCINTFPISIYFTETVRIIHPEAIHSIIYIWFLEIYIVVITCIVTI